MATKQQNAAKNAKNDTFARIKRTEQYAESVRVLFARCVNEILALQKTLPKLGDGEMYSFDGDSIRVQRKVEELLRRLAAAATLAVENGVKVEWDKANEGADALLKSCFGKKAMSDVHFSAWRRRNGDAMKAFQRRTNEEGLNLSDRIWKTTRQLREEMEVAMTLGIGEGESAADMSRKVRKYLNDPDLMFRRFRYKAGEKKVIDYDADGNPVGSHIEVIYGRKWKKKVKGADGRTRWIDYDKNSYKVGAGNYKSSARNAMRVTRTETNMAYRESDQTRWNQMDFVLGVHIELSRSHPKKDICDKLKGDYPKDFKFEGWHPQCFCVMTPILMPEDEMAKMSQAMLKGEKYVPQGKRITSYPEGFNNWVSEHQNEIAEAHKRGTDPYFIRHNFAKVEKVWNPEDDDSPLKVAERRHAARTEVQVADIKARWEAHKKQQALTKKTASNVLKVAEGYGGVDYSALKSSIEKGDLTSMQRIAKDVARQIQEVKAWESAVSDLIPNAHALHRDHTMKELMLAHDEIQGVMGAWLKKYKYASLDAAPLAHLKNKLEWEINNIDNGRSGDAYKNKAIIKSALTEKMNAVERQIEWNDLVARADMFKKLKTRSSVYKAYLSKIDAAILKKDLTALRNSVNEADAQYQAMLIKIAQRGIKPVSTKGALNKEYKGGVVGADISAAIDTRTMKSTDPYCGSRYTFDVAKKQGFDSPAKLVSEKDFESLVAEHGDIMFRTLKPATFRGKDMSAVEFANQMYLADSLELNGPGGRVYGDGIYVTTSAWNGRNNIKMTEYTKEDAYQGSRSYGQRVECSTLEMTWLRKPKLIKQTELARIWRALSASERQRFGNHDNTYACALGYDGMYCAGPNYMVIWNRSILAVKER